MPLEADRDGVAVYLQCLRVFLREQFKLRYWETKAVEEQELTPPAEQSRPNKDAS